MNEGICATHGNNTRVPLSCSSRRASIITIRVKSYLTALHRVRDDEVATASSMTPTRAGMRSRPGGGGGRSRRPPPSYNRCRPVGSLALTTSFTILRGSGHVVESHISSTNLRIVVLPQKQLTTIVCRRLVANRSAATLALPTVPTIR
jgi:hypothetical protein